MALRARGSYRHPARLDTVSTRRLGVWLALTQAGFPPACQSTISSPHVHAMVIRLVSSYEADRMDSLIQLGRDACHPFRCWQYLHPEYALCVEK
jgi:hypothetical protein